MRIQELLEGKFFNDLDFVKHTEGGREIDFDLHEDLVYFMNNDDQAYRRHVHPAVVRCLEAIKNKKNFKANIFAPAVNECYKMYVHKFPIRELPDELSEEMCEQICDKIYEEVCQHAEEGKYKD
jgi:hypothetical protein